MPRLFPSLLFLRSRLAPVAALVAAGAFFAAPASAHNTITGTVLVEETGEPAVDAEVILLETGDATHTDAEGRFSFGELEHGMAVASLHVDFGFLTGFHAVAMDPDAEDIEVVLDEPILVNEHHRAHEQVTVTASAGHASPLESFGQVHSVEGLDLANESARNIAELLEGTPGVAIRSFGPGSARPVVRGFDGDRVLLMEDGVRTGDLGSQSADHGVPVDPLQAERVEVVRGPATLLYGSNAIGGAVNVISMASHLAHSPPPGFRGQANVDWSSADEGVRGGVRAQAGGSNWFAWGGGNSYRSGDYQSPTGLVENSGTEMNQGEVGVGLFNDLFYWSTSARIDDSRYGVPFAGELHGAHGGEEEEVHEGEEEEHEGEEEGEEEHGEDEFGVDIGMQRRQFRSDLGLRGLAGFDSAELTVRYSDYAHQEIEVPFSGGEEEIATEFDNRSLVFRGELKRQRGRVDSRIGGWAHLRDYSVVGEEALAPPVTQNAFAAFAYNEIAASDRLSLLLGARVEQNRYEAGERPEPAGHGEEEHGAEEEEHGEEEEGEEEHEGEEEGEDHEGEEEEEHAEDEFEAPAVRDRDFLGVSGSAGLRLELNGSNSLVATTSLATRAPALEELYNFGLHVGNLAFEIGNPDLETERSVGVDLSWRTSGWMIGSVSLFRYDVSNFIFGSATGDLVDDLQVLESRQGDAVYQGLEVELHRDFGPFGLDATASWVEAELDNGQPLPRIPPLSGDVRLRIPFGGFRLQPRVRWAAKADRVYIGETPTDGYTLFDTTLSYVRVTPTMTHNISLRGYNLFDTEYRYHTSLIKDLAPQMGRGVRLSYSLRFF